MPITAISRDFASNPNLVRMISSDTIATVAAAGYLTDQADVIAELNNGVWQWLETDFVVCVASDDKAIFTLSTDFADLELYSTAGNGAVTLPVVDGDFTVFDGTLGALKDAGYSASDPAKTKVVMASAAVTTNALAVFADTAGTVKDQTTTATLGFGLTMATGNLTLTLGNFIASAGFYIESAANALTAHAGGGQGSALQLAKQINRVTTVGTAGDSVKLPAATAGKVVTVINAAAANAMDVFPQTGEIINALAANTALSVLADKTVTFYCAVAGTWNALVTS